MNRQEQQGIEFTIIPKYQVDEILDKLDKVHSKLNDFRGKSTAEFEYITAQEFMDACRISRSTFDELRQQNEIEVLKRGRKVYLRATSIRKYIEGK